MLKKPNTPFWIFTWAVLVLLIVPVLIQDGMFMDGQQYACVAKNLANGLGTFWHPYISATWWKSNSNAFMEHPPLVFGIQSLFFSVLGDSMYVERFYSFVTAVITALLITAVWKEANHEDDTKKLGWLPVLLWIIIPVCFWSYQNDMQENTMGIFTLASVLFSIRALQADEKPWMHLAVAGFFIFLASFSKGVPGLFPLCVPLTHWFAYQKHSLGRIILFTLVLLAVPAVIYTSLMLHTEARESLTFYVNERLLYRIHDEPTVRNRWDIVNRLFAELFAPLLVTAITLLLTKNFRRKSLEQAGAGPRFFFLLGLGGSVPIMLTLVQRGFYFVPALPYFAICLALLIAKPIASVVARMYEGSFFAFARVLSVLLFAAAVAASIMMIGKTGRDKESLHDVYTFAKVVPAGSTVGASGNVYHGDWAMQFYLIRYFNISEDTSPDARHRFYISEKDSMPAAAAYQKVSLETQKYDLYELRQ